MYRSVQTILDPRLYCSNTQHHPWHPTLLPRSSRWMTHPLSQLRRIPGLSRDVADALPRQFAPDVK
eukprot:4525441-Alexandrium_andersonii.AAC.1